MSQDMSPNNMKYIKRLFSKFSEYPDPIKRFGLIEILCAGDHLMGLVLWLINILFFINNGPLTTVSLRLFNNGRIKNS